MINQNNQSLVADAAPPLVQRYSKGLTQLRDMIRLAGYQTEAFNSVRASKFPFLPETKQLELITSIEQTLDIYMSAVDKGIDSKDNRQSAWWALRRLGYKPLSDAFLTIENEDVIEIYDHNQCQVFRTFNFFECLSYSLDDVYTNAWWDLYDREGELTDAIAGASIAAVSSPDAKTMIHPWPDHWVIEKFSEGRNAAEIRSRVLSPLRLSRFKQPGGFINAFKILQLRKRPHAI